MKKIIIIVALIMFLKPILPVIDYIINYDYISKVLCENKAKPVLKCNGKCHLMKELAKESESDKPISTDKKENTKQPIEVLFFQEIKTLVVEQIFFPNTILIQDNYSNLYFHKVDCSVFHPPTLSLMLLHY